MNDSDRAQLRATAEKALSGTIPPGRCNNVGIGQTTEQNPCGYCALCFERVLASLHDNVKALAEAVLSLTEPANAPCIKTFALGPEGAFGATGPGKTDYGVDHVAAVPVSTHRDRLLLDSRIRGFDEI